MELPTIPLRLMKLTAICCLLAGISFNYKSFDSTTQQTYSYDSLSQKSDDFEVYRHKAWIELPPQAQEAAAVLGWTQKQWDASEDSSLIDKPWSRLSGKEKIAAVTLGVDTDWTGEESWNDLHWVELPVDVRAAAIQLGYNNELWDSSKITKLAKEDWDELTNVQQAAAEVLDYDKQSWNDLVKDTRQSTNPNDTFVSIGTEQLTNISSGPPIFKLSKYQILCELVGFEVVCSNNTRTNNNVAAYPLFADYYTDGDGTRIRKQSTSISRPISTSWFRPNVTKFCGNMTDLPCANLGDELGPMLLLKLSGQKYIENGERRMDVVIIGSVLNFMVKKYNETVGQVGSHFNVTVWGTGTKWKTKGVCFDFRAVRGPKTRDKFLDQGCNVPEVYGDPALLFRYLYEPKKVNLSVADLCLVPHLGDCGEDFPWWTKLNGTSLIPRFSYYDHHAKNQTVRVLDIRTPDAAAFIDLLSTCKLVASASLHGMILAEAYNITWSWVRLRQKYEDIFKYNDFFLSVGIGESGARPLKVKAHDSIDKIIEHTTKPKNRGPSLYDPIKLLDACPFCDPAIVRDLKAFIMRN